MVGNAIKLVAVVGSGDLDVSFTMHIVIDGVFIGAGNVNGSTRVRGLEKATCRFVSR